MTDIHGHDLRQAFAAATQTLERYRDSVNAVNVFPVPDGDTGTNMLLTLRAGMDKCPPSTICTVSDVANGVAEGTFWGASGNSGVILSQFFRGFAVALGGKDVCCGTDLAQGFSLGASMSYQAVAQPVEGTMLTVLRSLSQAVQYKLEQGETSAVSLWATGFQAAKESLYHTPQQLAVLQEAGVVDAGGMGIVAIVGGALAHLLGWDENQLDHEIPVWRTEWARSTSIDVDSHYLDSTLETGWGYCIQYVIQGQDMELEPIRQQLEAMADSTVVVGTEQLVRVHFHAADPGPSLSYGASLGQLSQINIRNMSRQNEDFVTEHRSEGSRDDSKTSPLLPEEVPEGMAVVAVVSGEGMAQLFHEAGCAAVINAGQRMNPSVPQLMDAVVATGVKDVIILPNSNNVQAAEQFAQGETWGRSLHVVPCVSLPKGVAALLAFNPEETLERNLKAMKESLGTVRTIEVTQAVRATAVGEVHVGVGQYMALLDDEITAVEDTPELASKSALNGLRPSKELVVTLYWGAEVAQSSAEQLQRDIETQTPGIQVDLVYGGQPLYPYLAAVE